ncbi:hypothetical protein KAI87_03420 [Myxococcota bacterium]|nr:hypothetical protein [Myxococcota bacterium]
MKALLALFLTKTIQNLFCLIVRVQTAVQHLVETLRDGFVACGLAG